MAKKTEEAQVRASKIDNLFHLVKNEEGKVLILVGDKVVSNAKFDTFEQADRYIGTKPYELIFNVSFLICMHYEKNKQTKTTKKEVKKTDNASKENA